MVCDDQMVKEVLSGNKNAFRTIVERYKGYVFAIALNITKDYAEAENVAQEVFLQVYRSLPQYRFQNLKAWIGRIATAKSIDWKRAKARRYCEDTTVDIESVTNEADNTCNTPEEILLQKESRQQIVEVCKHMPDMYRSVLVRFYFEGKTYQQIALEDNAPLKTVESRIYRARRLFREKWRESR